MAHALVLFALGVVAGTVAAHGGVYPPPPDYGGPGDAVAGPIGPPLVPHGPVTRPGTGTSSPTTPGSDGPVLNGAGASTLTTPASLPTTGASAQSLDLTLWSWWWEFNKEPFLDLRVRLFGKAATTGDDGYFLGRGFRTRNRPEGSRPTRTQVRDVIVPALLTALDERPSDDVVTACLIALARIGEDHAGTERAELQQRIRPFLRSASQEVSETAVVALGILGDESAALLLGELVLDTDAARRSLRKGRIPVRTRAFSAYALGLLGHQTDMEDVRRYVVHKLVLALAEDDTPTADLGVACVLSLGNVPLAWAGELSARDTPPPATASREAQVLFLLDLLRDEKRHRLVRAHLPTALAGLLAVDAGPAGEDLRELVGTELIRRLDGHERELRQSCAVALGMIGDTDDEGFDRKLRLALLGASADADRQVRHLALIALGRIAARPGSGASADHRPIRDALLWKLGHDGTDTARWTALGLALLERGRTLAGAPPSADVRAALRTALTGASSPLDVGAFAIACGIAGDARAEEPLRAKLGTIADEQARGHVAIALGLLDARAASDEIRRIVEESSYRPRLLREGATALGLLGDPEVAPLLAEWLADSKSLAAQAALARALGRVGDRSSVGPLIEMLQDDKRTERARAFAAVALGILADSEALPWNTVLAVDTNTSAAPATLLDHDGFGILNLL